MVQKIILVLFLFLHFTIDTFANISEVAFTFRSKNGNSISKIYLNYENRLFYDFIDKNGNILPSNSLSFESENTNILLSRDNYISVFPSTKGKTSLEIIVK